MTFRRSRRGTCFVSKGDWFIGAQGNAANYQVLGATAEDDLVLETLGVRGFEVGRAGRRR